MYLTSNKYQNNREIYPSTFIEINIKTYNILFENSQTFKSIKIQSGKNNLNSGCLALLSLSNEINKFTPYTQFRFYDDLHITNDNVT